MRLEPEIQEAIDELKTGILDNNDSRRAIMALDFALNRTCIHMLTGKAMDLINCGFCKEYFEGNKK